MKNDFDPQKAFVAEDGYEYEDLADYLIGKKVDCVRNNRFIHDTLALYAGSEELGQHIFDVYRYYNRLGYPYAAAHYALRVPPGAERFDLITQARDAAGTRSPSPEQTAPDPVHAAN